MARASGKGQPAALDKSNHRIILNTFFRCQNLLQGVLEQDERKVKPEDREGVRVNKANAAAVWSLLREAHIFEFTSDFYSSIYHEADVYTSESITGEPWQPRGEPLKGDFDPLKFAQEMVEAGKKIAYPEKRPFEVCYLAWGDGWPITELTRQIYQVPAHIRHVCSLAHLIGHGQVWEILLGHNTSYPTTPDPKNPDQPLLNAALFLHEHYSEGEWGGQASYALAPWVVASVIQAINDNETFIEGHFSSLWDRETRKKFTKKEKRHFIPRPYYTVTIQPKDVKESLYKESLIKREIEPAYRHDRRGSYCSKIFRGRLVDLTDKLREQLVKRKYKIWTAVNPPDAEATAILMHKKQRPPSADEWVATLRFWRKETIVHKDRLDLPYIPSTRKLKGVRA